MSDVKVVSGVVAEAVKMIPVEYLRFQLKRTERLCKAYCAEEDPYKKMELYERYVIGAKDYINVCNEHGITKYTDVLKYLREDTLEDNLGGDIYDQIRANRSRTAAVVRF